MEKLVKIIATFFGLGHVPKFPGTATSLAVALLYCYFAPVFSLRLMFFIVFTVLGFLVSGKAEKIYQKKDALCITIDEASGMSLGLLFFAPTLPAILTVLAFFRLFDILKPFKIKDLQKFTGSTGIMIDDLAAALATIIFSYPIITYLL